MVTQKNSPLAVLRDVRRLRHDVRNRQAIFLAECHVHARHQRKVEGHVALIAIAEVRTHICRPLVGLGENHATFVPFIDRRANLLDRRVRLRKIFAIGAIAFDEVWNGIHAQSIDAHIQPVPHDVDDRFDNHGVIEIQIRLV